MSFNSGSQAIAKALVNPVVTGDFSTSGTGLDVLVDLMVRDAGLQVRLPGTEIRSGASAADEIVGLIIEAITQTGVADDGWISAGDLYLVNGYIRAHHLDAFTQAHGDDGSGYETGFHLVRGDGATGQLLGSDLVDTVADGLFHIGFEIDHGYFENEDGQRNVSVTTVSGWLNRLLADDLAAGTLSGSGPAAFSQPTSGTGLDLFTRVILTDGRLNDHVPGAELAQRAAAADALNGMLVEALGATGAGSDGWISVDDLYAVNAWLRGNRAEAWAEAFGSETSGFRAVLATSESTDLFGRDALDDVAEEVYKLGFELLDGRVSDGMGSKGADLETLSSWLGQLLRGDLAAGTFGPPAAALAPAVAADGPAVEGTGLTGWVYDRASGFTGVSDLIAYAAGGASVETHTFKAHRVAFGEHWDGDDILSDFLGDDGVVKSGDAGTDMTTIGLKLQGLIYIPEGWHDVTVRSDDGFLLKLNGEAFISHEGPRGLAPTTRGQHFEGGLYQVELWYYENWGDQGLILELDGEVVAGNAFYTNPSAYAAAVEAFGLAEGSGQGPVVAGDAAPATPGSGLTGRLYDREERFHTLDGVDAALAAGLEATHTLEAAVIDFGGRGVSSARLEDLFSGAARLTSGPGGAEASTFAGVFEGYVHIPEGWHVLGLSSDDGARLEIGGETLAEYKWTRAMAESAAAQYFEGGLYAIRVTWFQDHGGEGLQLTLDGAVMDAGAFYASVADFEAALAGTPPAPVAVDVAGPEAAATTGTGLDALVAMVLGDDGLNERLSDDEISEAAARTNTLNQMLVDAILATGIANDGQITGADLSAIADWIAADPARHAAYLEALGDGRTALAGDALGLGANAVTGTSAGEMLLGGDGEDRIEGHGGNDTIRAGLGFDTVAGGGGSDVIHGGEERDVIDGGAGGDIVWAGTGGDLVNGGAGADTLLGESGRDLILGGTHSDDIRGGSGSDALYGEAGNDTVRGQNGRDQLSGGAGHDTLRGEAGDDALDGGSGSDLLDGGAGHDSLVSASDGADDHLAGGAGADQVHIQVTRNAVSGALEAIGTDTIADFDRAGGDRILVHGEGVAVSGFVAGSDGAGAYTLVSLAGPGGALLGALKVYGDAVSAGDITLTGGPALDGALFEAGLGVYGSAGADTLEAGRGNQLIHGGAGDDVLVSTGDGGEPEPFRYPGSGQDGTVYDQPAFAGASDTLIGGAGHDTFRFLTLIDARPHILAEHTGYGHAHHFQPHDMMGMFDLSMGPRAYVDWTGGGVAGENQTNHDHWVDGLGDEVIADFNAAEDTIEILGHTTLVFEVAHMDSNSDGLADYSVIHVYSNQGNGGGAHNRDMLGTVTVYGDLVEEPMIVTDAGVHYGIDLLEGESPVGAALLAARSLETGLEAVFHEGASGRLFDEAGVDAVLKTLLYIGAGINTEQGEVGGPLGLHRTDIETGAYWLESLLADDLAAGTLANAGADPTAGWARTGTGLDELVAMIFTDEGLNAQVTLREMHQAADAAATINALIVQAIRDGGLYNDGAITASDVYDISAWIGENAYDTFLAAHGDDEPGREWGFHTVQNDGATARLFDENTINTVADGLYHIGFPTKNGRFLNEDGNANERVETIALWLDELLKNDTAALVNPVVTGDFSTSGTGLDVLVDLMVRDAGLQVRLPGTEIRSGASAADEIVGLIIEAITQTGVADDGWISAGDLYLVNGYIRAHHLDAFTQAHGDDGSGYETGFHLVRGDGATGQLLGSDLVDTVADGLFHIGFEIDHGYFENEDGQRNVSVTTVSGWLNRLLADDLAAGTLSGSGPAAFSQPTSGTGLDLFTRVILTDGRLNDHVPGAELAQRAAAADALNGMLVEALGATGAGSDGWISVDDLYAVNAWLRGNRAEAWAEAFGSETSGFRAVLATSESTDLFGRDALDDVAEEVYKLGFELLDGRVSDGMGSKGADLETLSSWLGQLLRGDLAAGTFGPPAAALAPAVAADGPAVEGTGLTGWVYDRASGFTGVSDLIAYAAGGASVETHTFKAHRVAFGEHWDGDDILSDFLGDDGVVKSGDAGTDMTTIGLKLQGLIYIPEGWHDVTVRSDDGFLLKLNGEAFISHEGPRGLAPTTRGQHFEGGLYQVELWYYENWGDQGLILELDGEVVAGNAFYTNPSAYAAAVEAFGLAEGSGQGPVVAGDAAPATPGSGLTGRLYDREERFHTLDGVDAALAAGLEATHTLEAAVIDFGGRGVSSARLEDLFSGAARLTSGPGGAEASTFAGVFEGYVHIPEGWHVLGLSSDDGARLEIGGETLAEYKWTRAMAESAAAQYFEGGLYAIRVTWFQDHGGEGLQLTLDGAVMDAGAFYASVADFEAALAGTPPAPVAVDVAGPEAAATTGTGLDALVAMVLGDDGLNERLSDDEISEAAARTNTLNQMLVDAILATGIANDGQITGADLSAIADWIAADPARHAAYLEALGDGRTALAGDALGLGANAVTGTSAGEMLLGGDGEDRIEGHGGNDTIRAGLGFDTVAGGGGSDVIHGGEERDVIDGGAGGDIVWAGTGGDLVNGGAGADTLLGESGRDLILGGTHSDDIRGGSGSDALYGEAGNDTVRGQNGRDQLSGGAGHDTLRGEAGDDALDGGSGSDLLDGGAGHDSLVSASDGADDHLAGGAGADQVHIQVTRNAVSGALEAIGTDTIADFDRAGGDRILVHGEGVAVSGFVAGSDGAGAYTLVSLAGPGGALLGALKVYGDAVSAGDITLTGGPALDGALFEAGLGVYGSAGADTLEAGRGNQLIHGGAGDDVLVSTGDGGEPEPFRYPGSGQDGTVYDQPAFAGASDTLIGGAGHDTFRFLTLIDARPHILAEHTGYGHAHHFQPHDMMGMFDLSMGPRAYVDWTGGGVAGENQTNHDHWVDGLGDEVIADFNAAEDTIEILGHTTLVFEVAHMDSNSDGLADYSVIHVYSNQGNGGGAHNRDMLGTVTVYGDLVEEPMIVTDAGVHYGIDLLEGESPVGAALLAARSLETGLEAVFHEGASGRLFDEAGVDAVLKTLLYIGAGINTEQGEVGGPLGLHRTDIETGAYWLESLLADDLAAGTLANAGADPTAGWARTGTGLDELVAMIFTDEGLNAQVTLREMHQAADAAATINALIVQAIRDGGLYNDGAITASDVYDISAWIGENAYDTFLAAHGDDEPGREWGFHTVQNDGATARLFDENTINTVADGLYHIGFPTKNGRFLNEDGNANERVETIALWLDELLKMSGKAFDFGDSPEMMTHGSASFSETLVKADPPPGSGDDGAGMADGLPVDGLPGAPIGEASAFDDPTWLIDSWQPVWGAA